jgi:thiosulfate/3-mercaptopyruvate sulfurtransferase
VIRTTLASPAELAANPAWRVFDCRHDLASPALGEQLYAQGHIPGALFAHLDRDLSAPKSSANGRHPLPRPEALALWLGRCGLRPGEQVVAYDAGNGTMAARLWWTLRWLGHEAAAVLDGGLAAWIAEGRPVTAELPVVAATRYPIALQPGRAVDAAYLERHLGSRELLLLDARTAARYRGETEPIDPVAGRIPGAANRFCGENLAPDGRFKPAVALREEFEVLLGARAPEEVVHYCGSGVAACHNALAMEIAGFGGSRVYVGSWSEWLADPRRPRASGA